MKSTRRLNNLYVVWLWLITIIIPPIVLTAYSEFFKTPDDNPSVAAFVPIFILFSLLFSSPIFLFVFLIYQSFQDSTRSIRSIKAIVSITSILLMLFFFGFFSGSMTDGFIIFYGVTIIIAGSVLKAENKTIHQCHDLNQT